LGSDIAGAIEPVSVGDALRKNSINLEFNNFNIVERGDLRDIARMLNGEEDLDSDGVQQTIPDFDEF
jgi:hypothetical protein